MDDSFIFGALEGISACAQGRIRIVQIGANDGATNDPIHQWVRSNTTRCELVLIEPQTDVFQRLRRNYDGHPAVQFHNKAVGPQGHLKLYRIRSEFDHLYKGIIASGITSYDRQYVLNKIKRNLDWSRAGSPEKALEEFQVECTPLAELMGATSAGIDFLQVDTEGFDDRVLYNCSIDRYRPRIINYEFIHLGPQRLAELQGFLAAQGYKIVRWSPEDECAVRGFDLGRGG